MVRYSFPVRLFHSLLHAGLSRRSGCPRLALVISVLGIFVLMRFGIVAFLVSSFTTQVFTETPVTLDAAWYSGYGLAAIALFAAVVLYPFHPSIGGQRRCSAAPRWKTSGRLARIPPYLPVLQVTRMMISCS